MMLKIRFNQLEMQTKSDFENLVNTHHAMFSEISFPEGWMETANYTGADVKNAGGNYAEDYGSTLDKSLEVIGQLYPKVSGDTISNRCFFGYKWENDKVVVINAIFPDEAALTKKLHCSRKRIKNNFF